jgi:hypothetical protein
MAYKGHNAPTSTYLPPADLERLREVARANERTLAGEIRFAIREHLRKSESPAGEPSFRGDSGVGVAGHVVPSE